MIGNINSINHNKKKKLHQQTHLLHHKFLNGEGDYGLSQTHKYFPLGSKQGVINYMKEEYNTHILDIEDEYISKLIEKDQGNDYFISMDGNQREKISNERKDTGYIPLRYFYEMMKPFEAKVSQLLQQLFTHSALNNEEFQVIINNLQIHPAAQKQQKDNFIFSSKFYKRQIRIFDALKQMLIECEKFYASYNDDAQNQAKGINYLESRNKILGLLDDTIPYINTIFYGMLKGVKKSQSKNNKNLISLRQQDIFQEEFAKSMNNISNISESINLFLRMWMGIVNTDLSQYITMSNGVYLDMALMKANIQEFIEIRSVAANDFYIVSSLNDPESQLFCKISKSCLLPIQTINSNNNNQNYDEQLIAQQMQNQDQQNNYQNQSIFDYLYSYQNYQGNPYETSSEQESQKQLMHQMIKNFMQDENMEIETSSLSSEKLFESIRESFIQLYNLDENSEMFYFDENYVQVNTIMEFEKTRLIKIVINKNQHNQKYLQNTDLNTNLMNFNPQDFFQQQRPFIIGISGSTRSGKGTLCSHLQILYGAKYICQDSYFNYPLIQSTLQGNAECKEAILWDQLQADIQQVISQNEYKVLILDGFQLYNHPNVLNMCDVRIFLDIPDEQIYIRRMLTKPVKESYFWKYIMQEYSNYRSNCLKDNAIMVLQSDQDQFTLFFLTLQLIQMKLNIQINSSSTVIQ
ncbi:AAA domain protein (macronuclear) [Tetrahymena thermophila SB210]|uniref:AAA domain protein n=1 Tax=Tetrahymena thermophila (strain SB210) TaxID=312017 RepID=I7LUG6_TETTS|nr:AAA domain protein [Tetrahymena thermophila SB210]EAR93735.1 AAA domain protein [Tetrahymena thermophila SB210]|eukprot:XP_001013980.1 AAA domain protein [Tetrahymena thermophila SB210]